MKTSGKSRRATKGEAINTLFVAFTLAMFVGLASDLIWSGVPDYEGSFYRAVYIATVLSVASLVLKLRSAPLFERSTDRA